MTGPSIEVTAFFWAALRLCNAVVKASFFGITLLYLSNENKEKEGIIDFYF
jgi:hypothetical protein